MCTEKCLFCTVHSVWLVYFCFFFIILLSLTPSHFIFCVSFRMRLRGRTKEKYKNLYAFFTRSLIQFQIRSAILIPQLSSLPRFFFSQKASVWFFSLHMRFFTYIYTCLCMPCVCFFQEKNCLRSFIHLFCSPRFELRSVALEVFIMCQPYSHTHV